MNLFDKAKQPVEPPEEQVTDTMPESDPAEQATDETGGTDNPAYMKAKELVLSKLYEEGLSEGLLKAIKSSPDLASGLAEQAQVVLSVADDNTGGSIPDELYMMFGIEMLGEVAEIAKAGGLPVNSTVIAAASQKFITNVVDDLGGDTTQVKAAMAQMDPAQVGKAIDSTGA